MEQTLINGWSYDVLAFQIKSKLYESQVFGDKPNNFYETLPKLQSDLAKDMMKDPFILNLTGLKQNCIEIELEQAMVEKIKTVLLELEVGNKEYFIDLLF